MSGGGPASIRLGDGGRDALVGLASNSFCQWSFAAGSKLTEFQALADLRPQIATSSFYRIAQPPIANDRDGRVTSPTEKSVAAHAEQTIPR